MTTDTGLPKDPGLFLKINYLKLQSSFAIEWLLKQLLKSCSCMERFVQVLKHLPAGVHQEYPIHVPPPRGWAGLPKQMLSHPCPHCHQ